MLTTPLGGVRVLTHPLVQDHGQVFPCAGLTLKDGRGVKCSR
jgi:hypothetical protein